MGIQTGTITETAALRTERDLYLRLLTLGHEHEIAPFLREALALIVQVTAAQSGYLELYDVEPTPGEPRWWIAHGFSNDDLAAVRDEISRGIITETVVKRRIVETGSAVFDDRFRARESVRLNKIQAVLCAPVGDDPPRGVLYLQGRATGGMFSPQDSALATLVGRHLAPLVDRIVARTREHEHSDPTRPYRDQLRLEGFIGRSRAVARLLKQVAIAAPRDVPVLLTGATGTGKSQIARLIHANSPRAARELVEVNCAALPDTVFESEMFGYRRGAFTGADQDRLGYFDHADGGTLFLDEIGELSMTAQSKLLQVLQSGTFRPLGAKTSDPVRVDVRVVAATNVALDEAVAEKRFRDDLRFRLAVVSIRVPSLDERREDIAPLAAYLCAQASDRFDVRDLTISRGTVRALETMEWPGNVRQLAHVIEHAVLLCAHEGARQIERAHLFPDESATEPAAPPTLQAATRQFQTQLLRATLEDTGWNVSETARRLDIAHSHVYRLMDAFGIKRQRP